MSCVHEFSLRMHTMVSNHASPASKLCSQDMRIACSARMCGRPAAAPYPGLRRSAVRQCERGESAAVHCPSVRPCKRGEPVAVPYPGVRPRKRGRPAAVHCPASGRVSAASLRPYLIPACVRASAAGLRPYLMPASGGRLHAVQVSLKGGGLNDEKMKCHLVAKMSPSRKIGDPLYTFAPRF